MIFLIRSEIDKRIFGKQCRLPNGGIIFKGVFR